ncbi:MAG: murein hydrolase activator EnvC family protein [Candidatus Merdivicinus sp.]|jgi:murein DD-endopeptidase MepM/ murein hydrolase activator NlpD
MHDPKKKTVAILTALCIGTVCALYVQESPVAEAASLSSLQSQQQKIEKELDAINEELSSLKNNIAKEQQYQDTLSQQIALNTQKVAVIDGQIAQLSQEMEESEQLLSETNENIVAKEEEIDTTTDQYKQRMRAMYMAGDTSSLEMLFSAGSFSEFLTNIEMMQAISEHDTALLETLRVQKSDLENQKSQAERIQSDITEQQEQMNAQKAEMEQTNAELQEAYEQSQNAIQNIEAEKEMFEQNAAAKQKEADQIEAEISAEIKRLQEENEKKQQAQNGGQSTQFSGMFARPTNDGYYISSGYGPRWGSFHSGIDITAGGCYGANIYASASGTVITAGWHWSYGNYVVIDHGGGYSTLYAHCSSLNVSVGQNVVQGQVIAKIGSTGQSTGPHLHFEVRINGTRQNPSNYVSY